MGSVICTPPSANDDVYRYHELAATGTPPVSESATFTCDFDETEVGNLFSIDLILDIGVGLASGSFSMAPGDSIEFNSSFYDILKIDNISGEYKRLTPAPVSAPLETPIVMGTSIWMTTRSSLRASPDPERRPPHRAWMRLIPIARDLLSREETSANLPVSPMALLRRHSSPEAAGHVPEQT